jgi:hypothetical protein
VFFGLRQKTIGDLDAACGPDRAHCPESMQSTASSGRTYTTISLVTLGVGIAGLGTAAAMLLLAPSPKRSETALTIAPVAPLSDIGASVVGRF